MKTDLEVADDLSRLAELISRWHHRLQAGADEFQHLQADLRQDLAQAEVVLVALKDILGQLDRDSRQSKSLVGSLGKQLQELAPSVAAAKGASESLRAQLQQLESFGGITVVERTLETLQAQSVRLQEEGTRQLSEAEQRLASLDSENQTARQATTLIQKQVEHLQALAARFEPEFSRADDVLRAFDRNSEKLEEVNRQTVSVFRRMEDATRTITRFEELLVRLDQHEADAQSRAEEMAGLADECRVATEAMAAWRQGQTEQQARWRSLNENFERQLRLSRLAVAFGTVTLLGSLVWWAYWLWPLVGTGA
ncbi:MAG: hypothetical protein FJY99_13290 [Candidatus Sericytochromatia bacterium]|nr:hypothetical protein [Candidatus Tanganyikabacteria bacterium]